MQANLAKYRVIMDSMTQHEKDEPLVLKSQKLGELHEVQGQPKKTSRNCSTNGIEAENDARNERR